MGGTHQTPSWCRQLLCSRSMLGGSRETFLETWTTGRALPGGKQGVPGWVPPQGHPKPCAGLALVPCMGPPKLCLGTLWGRGCPGGCGEPCNGGCGGGPVMGGCKEPRNGGCRGPCDGDPCDAGRGGHSPVQHDGVGEGADEEVGVEVPIHVQPPRERVPEGRHPHALPIQDLGTRVPVMPGTGGEGGDGQCTHPTPPSPAPPSPAPALPRCPGCCRGRCRLCRRRRRGLPRPGLGGQGQ